jgi:hypothetical protein
MRNLSLRFVTLLLAGLLAGAVGLGWLLNRIVDDAPLYVAYKQVEIPALTATLVPLGLVTMVLALLQAYLDRKRRPGLWLTLAATLGLLAMGLLTRFALFPINDQIMTWSAQAPPDDWHVLREQWNAAHSLRTAAGLASFVLLLLAALVPEQERAAVRQGERIAIGQRQPDERTNASVG